MAASIRMVWNNFAVYKAHQNEYIHLKQKCHGKNKQQY